MTKNLDHKDVFGHLVKRGSTVLIRQLEDICAFKVSALGIPPWICVLQIKPEVDDPQEMWVDSTKVITDESAESIEGTDMKVLAGMLVVTLPVVDLVSVCVRPKAS